MLEFRWTNNFISCAWNFVGQTFFISCAVVKNEIFLACQMNCKNWNGFLGFDFFISQFVFVHVSAQKLDEEK